eukprot:g2735.t1
MATLKKIKMALLFLLIVYAKASTNVSIISLSAGGFHTCALLNTSKVKCWGAGSLGRLGYGDSKNRGDGPNQMGRNLPNVTLNSSVHDIVAGGFHTCAVMADTRKAKCWGSDFYGLLGYADVRARGLRPNEVKNLPNIDLGSSKQVAQMVVGGFHTCALLVDGNATCWGLGKEGQLGRSVGLKSIDIGQKKPNKPNVNLGQSKYAVKMVAGLYHTCALLNDGKTKCWGANHNGQLGVMDGSKMGDELASINLGTGKTVVKLAAGGYHTCAILNDGNAKCWGLGNRGQLGYGDRKSRGIAPSGMGDNLPNIDLGKNKIATQIVAGMYHTCVLLGTGETKCWGDGRHGQLGYGDWNSRGAVANSMGDNLRAIDLGTNRSATQLTAGFYHTCALLDDGNAKCWGNGRAGRLGYGDMRNRGAAANEMGDRLPNIQLF